MALLSLWLGCGDEAQPITSDEGQPPALGLEGAWTTRGVDATFGEVEVEMSLMADGRLSMVLLLANGGRRSFPGTWEVDGEDLVLRGAYFEPDGESRVRFSLEDELLVLEDAKGQRQEWQRIK